MANGKPGAPKYVYTDEIGKEICDRIASGESLKAICRDEHLPSYPTVVGWYVHDENPGFATLYARARKAQAELFIDELPEIADNGTNDWMANNNPNSLGWQVNGEHTQRTRLRIDTRKWLAGKMIPKIYGDGILSRLADGDNEIGILTVKIINDPDPNAKK